MSFTFLSDILSFPLALAWVDGMGWDWVAICILKRNENFLLFEKVMREIELDEDILGILKGDEVRGCVELFEYQEEQNTTISS